MRDAMIEIAPEVDRLVWGVSKQIGSRHGSDLTDLAADVGLDSLEGVPHFADFWLTGALPVTTATVRLPYAPQGEIARRFDEFVARGLVEETGEGHTATDRFRPLLMATRGAQHETAKSAWAGNENEIAEADDLILRVIAAMSADHTVADLHRSLDEADSAFLRFFDHLVTLRYLRQHDHRMAWAKRGLSAQAMVVLTALWADDDLPGGHDGALAGLRADGYVAGDVLTDTGRKLRALIEDDTNRRAHESWATLDDSALDRLLALLRAIPSVPGGN